MNVQSGGWILLLGDGCCQSLVCETRREEKRREVLFVVMYILSNRDLANADVPNVKMFDIFDLCRFGGQKGEQSTSNWVRLKSIDLTG